VVHAIKKKILEIVTSTSKSMKVESIVPIGIKTIDAKEPKVFRS
jgi:hypothetical protein